MNSRRPFSTILALLVCALLVVPQIAVSQSDQAGAAGQHAGKVTIVLPIAYLIHETQQTPAKVSAAVYWGDVINTGHMSRARVALDDGSILSVGSDSNMTVNKHDAGTQQTDLELNYGRVRARAVQLAKPNAHFNIRTPAGVAGVVGTDFVIEYEDGTTHVTVREGKVRLCTYVRQKKQQGGEASAEEQAAEADAQAKEDEYEKDNKKRRIIGPCIFILAGATASARFDQSPTSPVAASPMTMAEVVNATNPSVAGVGVGAGVSAGTATAVGVGSAVAATIATVVVRSVNKTQTCSTPTGGIRSAASCVGLNSGISGQRPH